jgi:tellurite resistance protein TerC
MDHATLLWVTFVSTAVVLFSLDIKLSASKAHEISTRESLMLCSFWILIASAYGGLIGYLLDLNKMLEFFTAYVIEYSLSVDNMFVFLIIFSYFNIPKKNQPRILTWGILGAVFMRLVLIFAGVALIEKFHWITYFFGAVLIYTAVKMYFQDGEGVEPEKNQALKLFSKIMPFDMKARGESFFIRREKRVYATMMFATLIVIESSDLVFAVDSIPAVLAISSDKLIVYTSNVFAVVGLRSLYFLLASIAEYFRFLKTGVSVVLFYVGIKMITSGYYKIPSLTSLVIVLSILAFSIILSIVIKPGPEKE